MQYPTTRKHYKATSAFRNTTIESVHNRYLKWTDEEKQYVISNFVDKQSYTDIANHLNRTVIAVEGMAIKLGCKLPRPPKREVIVKIPKLFGRITRMQELLSFCTYVSRVAPDKRYLIDTAKKELQRLSGL